MLAKTKLIKISIEHLDVVPKFMLGHTLNNFQWHIKSIILRISSAKDSLKLCYSNHWWSLDKRTRNLSLWISSHWFFFYYIDCIYFLRFLLFYKNKKYLILINKVTKITKCTRGKEVQVRNLNQLKMTFSYFLENHSIDSLFFTAIRELHQLLVEKRAIDGFTK
jgi:hypothetical protein